MPSDLAGAREALARGDVLVAYDLASAVAERDPGDLDAAYLAALSLARAGASEHAQRAARHLVDRVDGLAEHAPASAALREDALALIARLAKDRALLATGEARIALAQRAAQLYEEVAARHEGYFSCVNAATLWRVAGDRARADALARRAAGLATAGGGGESDAYWKAATRAEVALLLGDLDAAKIELASAAELARHDVASLAVTRRQLLLVCAETGTDARIVDALAPPNVAHFCGHRADGDDAPANRFTADVERDVRERAAEFFAARRIGIVYGSLASGADIVIAETAITAGADLHAVLPFASDEFVRISVAPGRGDWVERYHRCLAAATSVTYASDSSYLGDAGLFGYASRIAMGHAVNRARFLGVDVEQLAVWDGREAAKTAGTAHDVAVWQAAGRRSTIVTVPAGDDDEAAPRTAMRHATSGRELGAIVFTDFRGFSRLRDEHFPAFLEHVFAALAREMDAFGARILWRNTWGDAMQVVLTDVTAAAECALALQDVASSVDLEAVGLPGTLALRIGAHVGPVLRADDPVSHRPSYWGRELTRAARIEPRTPEGEVYVTDAFAALLALEPDVSFATEYVGRITTAKDFETIPMYRLRRANLAAPCD
jgi:hypothetical protein